MKKNKKFARAYSNQKYRSERFIDNLLNTINLHFNFHIFSVNLFDTSTPFKEQIKVYILGNKLVLNFLNTRLKFGSVEKSLFKHLLSVYKRSKITNQSLHLYWFL